MTGLRWGARTDVGQVRPINQDNVYASAPVFAVADGMGGHAAGEVASRVALDALAEALPPTDGQPPSIEALVGGVRDANRIVFERANAEAELRGMGTTLCVLALVTHGEDEQLVVVNVGDSRGYVVQDGELLQITRDHSYVEDLVQAGEITREESKSHPRRNIVTRVLGIEPAVDVDTWEVVPFPGDRYLLCSDGLFNEVDDDELRAVLTQRSDPQEAADELVSLANRHGGHDNISVVIVDVTPGDTMAPADPTAAVALASNGTTTSDLTATLPAPAPSELVAREPVERVVDEPEVPPRRPRRLRLRSLALALLVLIVAAVAVGAIGYYGRTGYYVAFAGTDDHVAIYQGRPGGLLWLDPTVETTYPLTRVSVPGEQIPRLEEGWTFDQRRSAETYVANLTREAEELAAATSTTTTTAPPPTTTTVPVATTLTPEAQAVTTLADPSAPTLPSAPVAP